MKLIVLVATALLASQAAAYNDAGGIPGLLEYVKPRYSRQHPEGAGLYRVHLDHKSGWVLSVSVARSTGFAVLDYSAIAAIRHWRFHPGTPKAVLVPLQFAHKAPVGHGWHQVSTRRSNQSLERTAGRSVESP